MTTLWLTILTITVFLQGIEIHNKEDDIEQIRRICHELHIAIFYVRKSMEGAISGKVKE